MRGKKVTGFSKWPRACAVKEFLNTGVYLTGFSSVCDTPIGVINCKCSKGAIMVNCVSDMLASSDLMCMVNKRTQRS